MVVSWKFPTCWETSAAPALFASRGLSFSQLLQNFKSFPEPYLQSCKAAILKLRPAVTRLILNAFSFVTEIGHRSFLTHIFQMEDYFGGGGE